MPYHFLDKKHLAAAHVLTMMVVHGRENMPHDDTFCFELNIGLSSGWLGWATLTRVEKLDDGYRITYHGDTSLDRRTFHEGLTRLMGYDDGNVPPGEYYGDNIVSWHDASARYLKKER